MIILCKKDIKPATFTNYLLNINAVVDEWRVVCNDISITSVNENKTALNAKNIRNFHTNTSIKLMMRKLFIASFTINAIQTVSKINLYEGELRTTRTKKRIFEELIHNDETTVTVIGINPIIHKFQIKPYLVDTKYPKVKYINFIIY